MKITALVSLLFITMIPTDYKIILILVYFFSNNYNIGELTSTASLTTIDIFMGVTPVN